MIYGKAQASLMRGLLAWYEYTKDEKVLTAIKKAVQRTTQGYPAYKSEQLQDLSTPEIHSLLE